MTSLSLPKQIVIRIYIMFEYDITTRSEINLGLISVLHISLLTAHIVCISRVMKSFCNAMSPSHLKRQSEKRIVIITIIICYCLP